MLVGCSNSESTDDSQGSVYFLNFKPEQDAAYQLIAQEYTAETGVPVKVVTAASGRYESVLDMELSKADAPTLFQVNGIGGLHRWEDNMADISDMEIASLLNEDVHALTSADGDIVGIPFAVEGYGIICNDEIFEHYFELDNAQAESYDDIDDFESLSQVARDMHQRKDELGIDGAFSSISFAPGEDWRWQTHLTNSALWQELKDNGVEDSPGIDFTYNQEFKQIFDLYVLNSVSHPLQASTKTVEDSMAKFAVGRSSMVQNGNWAWSQIEDTPGKTIAADKVTFLPIYMGLPDESNYGLEVGTENYLAVNTDSSAQDKQATEDFVDWLFTSEEGKKLVTQELGFITPFTNFSEDEVVNDPLSVQVQEAMDDKSVSTIPWAFQYLPSQDFKEDFGRSLDAYANGLKSWDDVVSEFKSSWKKEKELFWPQSE